MGKPDQPRGPDGRWIKRPVAVVVSVTLAVAMASGPLSVSGAGGTASVNSSIGQTLRGKLHASKQSAAKGRRDATWKRLELKRIDQQLKRGSHCWASSYGQVQEFLLRTPCRSLDRMLFALDGGDGDRIAVSVSWVEMRSTTTARKLQDLVDVHGTGNITPLPGALVGSGEIRWTGRNYDSRRSRRLVVIAEVEPVHGSPEAGYLDDIADVAAEFPRP